MQWTGMWQVNVQSISQVVICIWTMQMERKGKISLGLGVLYALPRQEMNRKIGNSIRKSHSIQACLSALRWWGFSPSVPPEQPACCSWPCFLTLAEASSSLAFIAVGQTGNAYKWSSVACRLRLNLLSPVAPCCFGKIYKYINNSNTEINNLLFQQFNLHFWILWAWMNF